MGGRKRLRQLYKEHSYWVKLVFFSILSLLMFSVAILAHVLSAPPILTDILLGFAITFGAVGLLQFLWDLWGGEPIELRIDEVLDGVQDIQSSVSSLPSITDGIDEVKDEVREIQSSVGILSDLIDGNIGLERIWLDRQSWQWDAQDGLSVWQDRVCQAKKVDIVSNTLWTNWTMNRTFLKKLFENIAGGARVRILIYEPGSLVQRLRAASEKKALVSTKAMIKATLLWLAEDKKYVPGSMQAEIKATLLRLAEDDKDVPGDMELEIKDTLLRLTEKRKESLPTDAWKNLQVGLTHSSLHPAQIIRADDRMLVATYLVGKGGSPSPTMQLKGRESSHFGRYEESYYGRYEEQIDILWERARILDDEQFEQVLRKSGTPPTSPDEE